MKNFQVIISTTFIAGLMLLVLSCGSEVSSMLSSSTTDTRPGPATKLVFTKQPSGGIAGSAFSVQPVVTAQDNEGNTVIDYRGVVVLSITEISGTPRASLIGGTTILASDGIVEFKGLSIEKAGTGYTLTATSGNLVAATSMPFTILPGEPSRLNFTIQPSGSEAGAPIKPNPEVSVQDNYGNMVAGYEGSVTVKATVTYTYQDPSNPYSKQQITEKHPITLSGTTTVSLVNGVARFTGIVCELARPNYTLTAVSPPLYSATSSYFTISPGAPAMLEFTVQPSGCVAGKPFEEQPKVAVMDLYGNVVTSSRASITISMVPVSDNIEATLSGSTTRIAEDALGGLAAFTDLSIDLAGSGYRLKATTDELPSTTSQAFDVVAP